jgi:ATP-dependent DNA helicase RecQ
LYISPATYKIRKELAAGRREQIFAYAGEVGECRSAWLRRYFGEQDPAPCGVCDVCLARKKHGSKGVSPLAVLARVAEIAAGVSTGVATGVAADSQGPTVKQLVNSFMDAEPTDVLEVLDALVAAGKLTITATGTIKIVNRAKS